MSLVVLSVVLLPAATPAFAQVTLDLHALQALPGPDTHSAPARPAPRPAQHSAGRPAAEPSTSATEKASQPATNTAPAAVATANPATQPALPQAAPDSAAIAPIPPAVQAAPPPPPTVSDTAATAAEPTPSGLRLSFAPGQSDLSPDSATSLKKLAEATPSNDVVSFNVMAYAAGSPDDPSTARRVSLSRAMAVRSALVGDGVSSARIYVRALGEQHGGGPPDRVDVTVLGANAATQSASQASPK